MPIKEVRSHVIVASRELQDITVHVSQAHPHGLHPGLGPRWRTDEDRSKNSEQIWMEVCVYLRSDIRKRRISSSEDLDQFSNTSITQNSNGRDTDLITTTKQHNNWSAVCFLMKVVISVESCRETATFDDSFMSQPLDVACLLTPNTYGGSHKIEKFWKQHWKVVFLYLIPCEHPVPPFTDHQNNLQPGVTIVEWPSKCTH